VKSPFPYFGGKSRISAEVWRRFGTVRNYVEPFFGSGAVLLDRPEPFEGAETVNDLNGWLCNFWRALQADPDSVARFADWPVSELDLHARGDWLFYREGVEEFIEKLRSDPEYYDAKSAGYWVWGICCWIGSGWGPMETRQGVNRQRPHLGNLGQGVNRQRPHLGPGGNGMHWKHEDRLREYFSELASRLRRVRICCGDWSRVCGPTPTVKQGLTGVFLDPPYAVEDRANCYDSTEDFTVANSVREWCKEWGKDSRMRIALCGYETEHSELESLGWNVHEWKAKGGYASQGDGKNENCKRERIWFSPNCITVKQAGLFGGTP